MEVLELEAVQEEDGGPRRRKREQQARNKHKYPSVQLPPRGNAPHAA